MPWQPCFTYQWISPWSRGGSYFNNRFNKCKDVFKKDLADISELKRVRFLFQRLETVEHRKKLKNYFRPKELDDLKFEISMISRLFGEKSSEFHKYFKCLTLRRPVVIELTNLLGLLKILYNRIYFKRSLQVPFVSLWSAEFLLFRCPY